MKILTAVLLLSLALPATAFELATRITRDGDSTRLETSGYTKIVLLKQETALTGSIVASGRLSVSGTASVVMWSRVDGRYYFSKLPQLQNVSDSDGLDFEIPFDAGDKTVTEVLIEVETPAAGSVTIDAPELRGR
ncbi:MAG: hypothetical protein PVI70_16550 [Gammaproteobacteria bacterium]|jgi:hypothetical protein